MDFTVRRHRRRYLTLFSMVALLAFMLLKLITVFMYSYQSKYYPDQPLQRLMMMSSVETRGIWSTNDTLLNFLQHAGSFSLNIVHYRQQSARLTIKIVDGIHFDDHQIKIIAPFTVRQVSEQIHLTDINSTIIEGDFYNDKHYYLCPLNISFSQIQPVTVITNITSSSCPINITSQSQIGLKSNSSEVLQYTVLASLIAGVNLVWTVQTLRNIFYGEINTQLSGMAITLCSYQDAYITLLNFYLASHFETFNALLMIPSLLFFMLFALFETKLIQSIYQNPTSRGSSIKFHFYFYTGLFIYIQSAVKLIGHDFFLLIINSHILLQVYQTAKNNCCSEIYRTYYIGFLVCRIALPIYFRACPNNFLRLQSRDLTLFSVFIGIQIALMLSQYLFGPRWFIPKIFLPKKFNYFEKVEVGPDEECAICLNPLAQQTTTEGNHLQPYQKLGHSTMMTTPCSHTFHVNCLTKWFNIKQTCPTCRAQLPVPY